MQARTLVEYREPYANVDGERQFAIYLLRSVLVRLILVKA